LGKFAFKLLDIGQFFGIMAGVSKNRGFFIRRVNLLFELAILWQHRVDKKENPSNTPATRQN